MKKSYGLFLAVLIIVILSGCPTPVNQDLEPEKEEVTVRFFMNYYGAEKAVYKTVKAEKGGRLEKPIDPWREGYRFEGWCTVPVSWNAWETSPEDDETECGKYIFSGVSPVADAWEFSRPVENDLDLYACWENTIELKTLNDNYFTAGAFAQRVFADELAMLQDEEVFKVYAAKYFENKENNAVIEVWYGASEYTGPGTVSIRMIHKPILEKIYIKEFEIDVNDKYIKHGGGIYDESYVEKSETGSLIFTFKRISIAIADTMAAFYPYDYERKYQITTISESDFDATSEEFSSGLHESGLALIELIGYGQTELMIGSSEGWKLPAGTYSLMYADIYIN